MRAVIRERGLTAFLSALLAFGLMLTLSVAFAFNTDARVIALVCAACMLFYLACAVHWAVRFASVAALSMIFIYVLLKNNLIPILAEAAAKAVSGDIEALVGYAPLLIYVAAAMLTLFCMIANRQREGFYPCLSLACVVALWSWVAGSADQPLTLAPVLVALAALYARAHCDQTSGARALSMAGLAVVLAMIMLPSGGIINDKLAELADRVRQMASDYLFYDEERRFYSIQYDGYQPLGDRLGGPMRPSDRAVMKVETAKTLLLRSVTKDSYDGKLWTDTLGARRYLYVDPRWRGVRANLLDQDRPQRDIRDADMFAPVSAYVEIMSASATTLFVPHRLEAFDPQGDLVAYFNSTGELFATRDLVEGDAYEFSAPVISIDDPGLPAIVERAAQSGALDWDAALLDSYRALPGGINQNVYNLTNSVIQNADTPLEKLIAIRDELQKLPYTLTPSAVPPRNSDFVSFFLMEGREGYCTYFASAMAIMGRIAGIPTRYVEGFLVTPDDSGAAYVTGRNAHAWTEAYLAGFGWISVDATPGIPPDGSGDGDGGDPNPPAGDEPTPSVQPAAPTTTPSPNPTPTSDDGGIEPTPSPSDAPEGTDTDEPNDGESADDNISSINHRLWWWLLIALAISGIAARSYLTAPASAAKRRKLPDERLLTWYRAALRLLAAQGVPAAAHETPAALARRAPALATLFDSVERLAYGGVQPTDEVLLAAAGSYRSAHRSAKLKEKARVWIDRMIYGAGKVRKVP
ncbi:MAG: transglutaminase-like domain-containing protein [Oscillospiraceae bacterium]|jgi:transglutaminase-like putative cysteine protease|nr:transglutaminase-like domain-containing protein [Oscillospiraceae bacterium]